MNVRQVFWSVSTIMLVVLYANSLNETKSTESLAEIGNENLRRRIITKLTKMETNEQFMTRISERMKERRKITEQACTQYGLRKRSFKKQLMMEAKKFNFLYCRIPKAGSGNMGRLFRDLIDLKDYKKTHLGNRSINDPHAYEFITQKYFKNLEAIKNYTTFMITRDPFVRLVSSYQKKVAGKTGSSETTLNETWTGMDRVPTNSSFSDFVSHVLYKNRGDNVLERHWALYYELCQPCHIRYDVIANLETIEEDTRYFLNLIGAPRNISYPSGYGKKGKSATTENKYMRFYSNLSKEKRVALYKQFELDFKLFNYTAIPYVQ